MKDSVDELIEDVQDTDDLPVSRSIKLFDNSYTVVVSEPQRTWLASLIGAGEPRYEILANDELLFEDELPPGTTDNSAPQKKRAADMVRGTLMNAHEDYIQPETGMGLLGVF